MRTRVIVAGATGWAGSALALGIAATTDLHVVGAVSRSAAGQRLGDALNDGRLSCTISATAKQALQSPCDVFFEYTHPSTAAENVLAALEAGAHVVIGTSGLTDAQYTEIDRVARKVGRGALACGNFALTVVLLQRFAEVAARYIPAFEIIDYGYGSKADSPSGTARELAHRLGNVQAPHYAVSLAEVKGEKAARGATLNNVQVHSLRLPGFVSGIEAVFGMPDQRLHIRHEAGSGATPYVDGGLLAIRKVGTLVGLHRGLDKVMDFAGGPTK